VSGCVIRRADSSIDLLRKRSAPQERENVEVGGVWEVQAGSPPEPEIPVLCGGGGGERA
jgi:hypothetical protein